MLSLRKLPCITRATIFCMLILSLATLASRLVPWTRQPPKKSRCSFGIPSADAALGRKVLPWCDVQNRVVCVFRMSSSPSRRKQITPLCDAWAASHLSCARTQPTRPDDGAGRPAYLKPCGSLDKKASIQNYRLQCHIVSAPTVFDHFKFAKSPKW